MSKIVVCVCYLKSVEFFWQHFCGGSRDTVGYSVNLMRGFFSRFSIAKDWSFKWHFGRQNFCRWISYFEGLLFMGIIKDYFDM